MPQTALVFIAVNAELTRAIDQNALHLTSDADAETVALDGLPAITLFFARFTDGRAYSQAVALRRRGFGGPIVARGDVLADQALQLARCGFSHAVLRADQSVAVAQRQLQHFAALSHWYQPVGLGLTPTGAAADPASADLASICAGVGCPAL